MTTVVARIVRVASGHSSTALIHAVDDAGHELRLEVPTEAAEGVNPNQVLVLNWSVHTLAHPVPIEVIVTTPGESSPTATTAPLFDARPTSASGEILDAPGRLEQLLGLQPGRLRGM